MIEIPPGLGTVTGCVLLATACPTPFLAFVEDGVDDQ
jgi:hypothetical protein